MAGRDDRRQAVQVSKQRSEPRLNETHFPNKRDRPGLVESRREVAGTVYRRMRIRGSVVLQPHRDDLSRSLQE